MRLQGGRGTGGTAGLIDGLRELFEPAHRHTVEQREHERLVRHTDEDGAPPTGPVDLDSGKVRVRRPHPPA